MLVPLVWVVDSAYTGELNARIGLAERLGYSYEVIPMPSSHHGHYNLVLKQRYLRSTQGNKQKLLIISGTGEETIAEIADLKILFEDCLNVYLASILPALPHPRLSEYDLVASPQFKGTNIIPLISVLHNLTPAILSKAYQQHQDYFNTLPKPVVALLLGGNTRYCDGFNEAHVIKLAKRIAKLVSSLGGFLVITNSRRTPASALNTLLTCLDGISHFFFDWQHSLSMCSEAAFTGKPVLVDLSEDATENYHRELVGKLIDYGAVKVLGDQYESWSYLPLDPTGDVARVIESRLSEVGA